MKQRKPGKPTGTIKMAEHEINGNHVEIWETTGLKHTWYDILVDGTIINEGDCVDLDHVPTESELIEILADSIRDEETGEN